MTGIQLSAEKDGMRYVFSGSVLNDQEASFVTDVFTSAREGLEANGFSVDLTLSLSKEFSL